MRLLNANDELSRRIRGRNTLFAGCATTLTVLLLAGLAYLAWANVLPAPERDPPRVLPSPNGYDVCAAAMANLPETSSTGGWAWDVEHPLELLDNSAAKTPWESDLPTLRREITQIRPGLKALSAAVRLPYLSPEVPDGPNLEPELYLGASQQLVGLARLELADGRPGSALERSLDVIELGLKMGRSGPFGDVWGFAVIAMGQHASEQCVSHLSREEARQAGRRLGGILAQLPEPADMVGERRRSSLAWVRDVFAGRAHISSFPSMFAEWDDYAKERALLPLYPKSWGYQQVDRRWRSLESELRKPYLQRKSVPASPPDWDPVLGSPGITLPEGEFPFTRTQTLLRLFRVELALREYHQRQGAYPAALRQLVPRALAVVPVDPFSDQPFRYRRRGTTYLLYSVGPDGKDDGGASFDLSTMRGDFLVGKLPLLEGFSPPPPPE
jgi:hypothetical protein